jgi:hypothetical protein
MEKVRLADESCNQVVRPQSNLQRQLRRQIKKKKHQLFSVY